MQKVHWKKEKFTLKYSVKMSYFYAYRNEGQNMSKTLFVKGWSFAKFPLETSDSELLSCKSCKPVDIPHDWLIYNANDLYESSYGVYKKTFKISPVPGHTYILRFEGVYQDSRVIVNGTQICEWKYGYSTFDADMTDSVKNGENEVCVLVKYESPNTRWYSGAGIYRNVYFIDKAACHFVPDGIYTSYTKTQNGYSFSADMEIMSDRECDALLTCSLKDRNDKEVFSSEKIVSLKSGMNFPSVNEEIENPTEWDIKCPNLYTFSVSLSANGEITDEESVRIGFRTIEFDPDKGFLLNGRRVQINGVCQHHDLGALGSAVNKTALRRQLVILKKMGVNSVRTSHNMPSVELMELADEMGILICSEAFDMWENKKTTYDYGNYFPTRYENDVRSWVRRDRNHASLIMWSIGNEITDTNEEKGIKWTTLLRDAVRENDYRHNAFIGIGSNYVEWEPAQKCSDLLELSGYNYGERLYDAHHKKYPGWCIFGSETSSTVQSRGIYHFPYETTILTHLDGQCSSLGNCTTNWGAKNTDTVIASHRDREFVAGQYLWSGFDYIGEPTPFFSKNSFFGQIDTAGFEKDTYYHYQAEWTDYHTSPMVHLLPYWDFNEGQIIDVCAYSNAPFVELFVNGVSMGKQFIDHSHSYDLQGRWKVPYHKGEIKVIATDENGNEVATDIRKSFGDPSKVCITPDKNTLLANGEDLIFLTISTIDSDGNHVANARNRMNVSVEGPGRLVGLDNGDSTDYEEYKGSSRCLFSGKLLAIIAATDKPGDIKVKVTSRGLTEEVITLSAVKCDDLQEKCYSDCNYESEEKGDVPVRKIELYDLSADFAVLTPDCSELTMKYRVLPENATFSDITFRALTKDAVDANFAKVSAENGLIHIKAIGDGQFRLFAFCSNGKDHPEIMSDYEFTAEGLGTALRDAYSLIPGIQYDDSSSSECDLSFEGGVFLPCEGEGYVTYNNVSLDDFGSDEITIPIFSFHDDVDLEIYEGTADSGECLFKGTYHAPTWYNHYQENTFKLSRKVKGITTITLSFHIYEKISIQGFYFTHMEKAYSLLKAPLCDRITGDSFTKTEDAVNHIGNNVCLDFDNMDFSEKGIARLEIEGKSHNPATSVHLLFFTESGQVRDKLEIPHTEDYETFSFEITGVKEFCSKLSVLFLPGTDFDFRSIKFYPAE